MAYFSSRKNSVTKEISFKTAPPMNTKIRIRTVDGVIKTYIAILHNHGGISTGDVLAQGDAIDGDGGSDTLGSGDIRIGMIAFKAGTTGSQAGANLIEAIDHQNGHNQSLTRKRLELLRRHNHVSILSSIEGSFDLSVTKEDDSSTTPTTIIKDLGGSRWRAISVGSNAGSHRAEIYSDSASSGDNTYIYDIKRDLISNERLYTHVAHEAAAAYCIGFSTATVNTMKLNDILQSNRRYNLEIGRKLRGLGQEVFDKDINAGKSFIVTNEPAQPINSYGFPSHTKYSANPDQEVSMKDYIDRPFLVERIAFELDVEFANFSGGGYHSSRSFDEDGNRFQNRSTIHPQGITCFILNQIKGSPSQKSKQKMLAETVLRIGSGNLQLGQTTPETEVGDVYLPRGRQIPWNLKDRPTDAERFPDPQIWPPLQGGSTLAAARDAGWSFAYARVKDMNVGNANDNANNPTTSVITTAAPWSTPKFSVATPGASSFNTRVGYIVRYIRAGFEYVIINTSQTTTATWQSLTGLSSGIQSGATFVAQRDGTVNDGGGLVRSHIGAVTNGQTLDIRVWDQLFPADDKGIFVGHERTTIFNSDTYADPTGYRSNFSLTSYLTSDRGYRVRMLLRKNTENGTFGQISSENSDVIITIYASFIDIESKTATYDGTIPVGRIENISDRWAWFDVPIYTYDGKGRKFNLSFVPSYRSDFSDPDNTTSEVDKTREPLYLAYVFPPVIDIAFASMYETEEVVKADTFRDLVGFANVALIDTAWNNGTTSTASNGDPRKNSENLSDLSKNVNDMFDIVYEKNSASTSVHQKIRVSVPCKAPQVKPYSIVLQHDANSKAGARSSSVQDLIAEWNALSRSGTPGFQSGRSVAGREIGGSTPAHRTMGLATDNQIVRYSAQTTRKGLFEAADSKQEVSPYLLFPEDNLIIGVQNFTSDVLTTDNASSGNADVANPGNTVHKNAVVLKSGPVIVKLYGSYIKQGFPDQSISSRDNLVSIAAHEVIGNEPVTDKYDTVSKSALRKSYIDRVMFGNPSLTDFVRGREIARLGLLREPRFNKTIWDTTPLSDPINPVGNVHDLCYVFELYRTPDVGTYFSLVDETIPESKTVDGVTYTASVTYVFTNVPSAGTGKVFEEGDTYISGAVGLDPGDPRIGGISVQIGGGSGEAQIKNTIANLKTAIEKGHLARDKDFNRLTGYMYTNLYAPATDETRLAGEQVSTQQSNLTMAVDVPKTFSGGSKQLIIRPFLTSDEKGDIYENLYRTTGAFTLRALPDRDRRGALIARNTSPINAGSFQASSYYQIRTLHTALDEEGIPSNPTDFTAIGAPRNVPGIIFKATGAGSGDGTARELIGSLRKFNKVKPEDKGTALGVASAYLSSENLYTRNPIFNRGIVARPTDNGSFMTGSLARFVKALEPNKYAYDTILPPVVETFKAFNVKAQIQQMNEPAFTFGQLNIHLATNFSIGRGLVHEKGRISPRAGEDIVSSFVEFHTGSFLPIFQRCQIVNGDYGHDLYNEFADFTPNPIFYPGQLEGTNTANQAGFLTSSNCARDGDLKTEFAADFHGLRTFWSRFPFEKQLPRSFEYTDPNTMRIERSGYYGYDPAKKGILTAEPIPKPSSIITRINICDVNVPQSKIIRTRAQNYPRIELKMDRITRSGHMITFGTTKFVAVDKAFYDHYTSNGTSTTPSHYRLAATFTDPSGNGPFHLSDTTIGAIPSGHYAEEAYMFCDGLTGHSVGSRASDGLKQAMKMAAADSANNAVTDFNLANIDTNFISGAKLINSDTALGSDYVLIFNQQLFPHHAVIDDRDTTNFHLDHGGTTQFGNGAGNINVTIHVGPSQGAAGDSHIIFQSNAFNDNGQNGGKGAAGETVTDDGVRSFTGRFHGGLQIAHSPCHFTASIVGFGRSLDVVRDIKPESELDAFSPFKNPSIQRDALKAIYGFETSFGPSPTTYSRGATSPSRHEQLYDKYGTRFIRQLPAGKLPDDARYGFGIGDAVHAGRVIVRGMKYGVMNSYPLHPSAVLNHRSHGQFRDLLEQRLYTLTLSEVKLGEDEEGEPNLARKVDPNDGPVFIRFVSRATDDRERQFNVNPIKTSCQNLSTYATSSLPFFDEPGRQDPNSENAKQYGSGRFLEIPTGRDRSTLEPDLDGLVSLD